MFVTKNQIFIFIACVAFGGVSGLLYSISGAIKFFFKNKLLKIIFDALISLPIGVLFVVYAHQLNFPNTRGYMLLGVFTGIYLYFKSFYIILAKCAEKIYNICKQKRKIKNDRNQSKKINRRRHGRRGVTRGNIAVNNGLSTNIHSRV